MLHSVCIVTIMKNKAILFLFILNTTLSIAQTTVQYEVEKLKNDPALQSAVWGFYAYNLSDNKVEADYNGSLNLVPASVMKTVSTATALELLGPDFTFKTRFYVRGEISPEGILNGDLIIRGGGDPSFASETYSGKCQDCVLNEIIDMLQKNGIKLIAGDILADDSYFEALMTPGGWNFSDIGNRYGASPSGLSFADNTMWFMFQSHRAGSKAEFIGVKPYVPGIQVYHDVYAGSLGDNAYVYGAEYSNHRYLSGLITPNQKTFEVKASMPDPPFTAAYTLYSGLIENGIYVTGIAQNITQARLRVNYDNPNMLLIGTMSSPPLSELVKIINKNSNNLYAEHIHKALSAEKNKQGSNKESNQIITDFWIKKGISPEQFFVTDGSGLSRSNAISAKSVVFILNYMQGSKHKNVFRESLSIAGVDGTLRNMTKNTKAENNVYAKSGTMNRIKAYAGYAYTRSGKLITFCIIANNFNTSSYMMSKKMENMMVKIAELP